MVVMMAASAVIIIIIIIIYIFTSVTVFFRLIQMRHIHFNHSGAFSVCRHQHEILHGLRYENHLPVAQLINRIIIGLYKGGSADSYIYDKTLVRRGYYSVFF